MNDPELDEPIERTANEVDRSLDSRQNIIQRKKSAQEQAEVQEEQREHSDFHRPTRWWLVSTLFPLIGGTLGPIANLFSVCALVQTWRINNDNGERIPDPSWVIAVNTVSLVFALVANLLLLLTFARRIRYLVSMPMVIILWYASSVTLIVLLVVTHRIVHTHKSQHVSQSYYYGLISSILYALISILLSLNYLFAHPKLGFKAYKPTFGILTMPQRTLMLQTTSFTLYLALGAGVFARIEGWDFVDGVYWADYTVLTIGLGADFPFQKAASKGLLMPWAVGGITIVGLIVSSVRSLVLERGKRKVGKSAVAHEVRKWRDVTETGKEWSKEEFDAMRRIQERATTIKKYTSLGVSAFVFIVFWFCGALVFWFTEHEQSWTYPNSLYFTYIVLLTIGYGDLFPQSTAGKPFFVLWTLLAVPAVTVLISNMGSTVVDFVRNGTLWLGSRTVLPERKEKRLGDELGKAAEVIEKTSPGGLAAMIAREIRTISVDVGKKPPRRYQWEDWRRWMELLKTDQENGWETSLLDDDGPLFSELNETEWILEKLCSRLEGVLRNQL